MYYIARTTIKLKTYVLSVFNTNSNIYIQLTQLDFNIVRSQYFLNFGP